jgi:hypothetical protein
MSAPTHVATAAIPSATGSATSVSQRGAPVGDANSAFGWAAASSGSDGGTGSDGGVGNIGGAGLAGVSSPGVYAIAFTIPRILRYTSNPDAIAYCRVSVW